jgi:precorrin-3B synthase
VDQPAQFRDHHHQRAEDVGMIRGWCPGALRPMPAGDGLIVRLRLRCGILDGRLAQKVAAWSRQWGNGQIDLSNRANLQLRGVSPGALPALQDALATAGLLDDSAAGEAVRNVIASPLAGIDPDAILDIRPVVARLGERLAGDPVLHVLPGKFGFAVDDGGRFGLDDVPADVWFTACRGPGFVVRLAGSRDVFGPCSVDAVPETAAAIAKAFLRQAGARRMRDVAADRIARSAGFRPVDWGHGFRGHESTVGVHRLGGAAFLGIGLPFGRIAAADLADLGAVATELRLTPWRAVLLPVASVAEAHAITGQFLSDALILDPTDSRLHVAACPGAPACSQGSTVTRDDATILVSRLPPGSGIAVHVSGCAKGCAHPRAAPITLVGRDGLYDLVRHGTAASPPSLRGLTLAQAAEHLR